VLTWFPTKLLKLSSYQPPTPNPTFYRFPPYPFTSLTRPSHHPLVAPTSPYLATNTLYHIFPWSPYILQHHFPSKAKLNSRILITPKPHSSLTKQIDSQFIQEIFLKFSPPKKIIFKIDYIQEMVQVGVLKKERKSTRREDKTYFRRTNWLPNYKLLHF